MQETIGEGHVRVKPREPRGPKSASVALPAVPNAGACRAINLLNLPGVSAPAQSWLGEAAHP